MFTLSAAANGVVAETLGLPIITISGKNEAIIENHKGITEYEHTAITVRAAKSDIRVIGRNLGIKTMDNSSLTITGEIDAVNL